MAASSVPEGSDFLYPFSEEDERDAGSLLVDLAESASAKTVESARITSHALDENGDEIRAAASAMADRLRTGGRLYTFGNGGRSTHAPSPAAPFATPPSRQPVAARCLVDDTAIVTALGHDAGLALVFS